MVDQNAQIAWIIDNDEIYKYGFCKYVEVKELCARVVAFSDGRKAIRFLTDPHKAANLPDIIFMTIEMPLMNGWEFIKAFEQIKAKIDKKISIFLLTSSISYQDILQAQNHPDVTDYMMKPVDSRQFDFAFTSELSKKTA
ncbi:Response regulator receiver domain-containing protein [Mucilaginibacter mallensis]|uniref:Response regulator receiver domain-containing protein n=1 Tax=Mucilaginibacter mallensis TaxID=652787 RepID=A0A1H1XBR1_MUCMA|nr:response regulator [Mucilaginibacter mallensis]SDT06550.1 Response regulator receiver domain-containing protein [Mucilaginibacter mallensis]